MSEKPNTCQDELCTGGLNCSMCINRSVASKEGYKLIQLIEKIPASQEQTEAVSASEKYIKICEDFEQAKNR